MIPRHLVDPQCPTSRPSIPMPSPLDVALAPQLLAVALAQAALAATHRALENAHPILAATSRHPQNLAASEHFAILVLQTGGALARLLVDYANAVTADPDADDLPF